MKKSLHNQNGFSIIELVLVVIVLCLLVAVGYLAFALRNQTDASSQAAENAAAISDILTRAKHVIDYDINNHGPDVPQQLHAAGYVTQKLSDYIDQQNNSSPEGAGEDLIICAQAFPDSWSYGSPAVNTGDTAATLSVTGNYSSSGPNTFTTDWVKTGGVWQEDAVHCPGR